MTPRELVKFIDRHSLAIQASSSAISGAPQAAVVGVVVTDRLELFFDTVDSSRKCQNLRRDPRVALVIGWDDDQTVQYEGIADEPHRTELDHLQSLYFARFPEGPTRQTWPGIAYFRVRPTWVRYADFREGDPRVVEFTEQDFEREFGPAPI